MVGAVCCDVVEGVGLSAVVAAVMDVVGLGLVDLMLEGAVGARDLFVSVSGGVSEVGGIG